MCTGICLGFLAILFPPLPVWVKRGLCSADSLINICLCLLGVVPGVLHAWYIIAVTPDNYGYEPVPYDSERAGGNNNVHYVYVQAPQQPQPRQEQRGYGTTAPGQAQRSHRDAGPASGAPADGDHDAPPPAYQEAVKGDHKVQRP